MYVLVYVGVYAIILIWLNLPVCANEKPVQWWCVIQPAQLTQQHCSNAHMYANHSRSILPSRGKAGLIKPGESSLLHSMTTAAIQRHLKGIEGNYLNKATSWKEKKMLGRDGLGGWEYKKTTGNLALPINRNVIKSHKQRCCRVPFHLENSHIKRQKATVDTVTDGASVVIKGQITSASMSETCFWNMLSHYTVSWLFNPSKKQRVKITIKSWIYESLSM